MQIDHGQAIISRQLWIAGILGAGRNVRTREGRYRRGLAEDPRACTELKGRERERESRCRQPVGDWGLAGERLYLRSLSASSERTFFSFLRKRCVLASEANRIAHVSAYDLAASSYDDKIPYDSSSSATALSSAALPWSHSSSQAPSSAAYGSSRSNCEASRREVSQGLTLWRVAIRVCDVRGRPARRHRWGSGREARARCTGRSA